jgi:hypothetical protein
MNKQKTIPFWCCSCGRMNYFKEKPKLIHKTWTCVHCKTKHTIPQEMKEKV